MRLVKVFEMECAHQLPNHDGKCRRLHGHSYKVEIAVDGAAKGDTGEPDEGMVVDFAVISAAFKERVFKVCDHQYLNEVLPIPVTTAEWIASWIHGEMSDALDTSERRVAFVRVWETATGYAEFAT